MFLLDYSVPFLASLTKSMRLPLLPLAFLCCAFFLSVMAEQAKVYIVHLERQDGVAPEALEASHLQTLTSVVGSEEAARAALVYSYKTVTNGFSAKLTPSQAAALKEKPGVLQVVPSQTLHLQKEVISSTTNMT